ncbi:MAG: histidine kinase [Eubacteriales bacterium]|nr:histidine kinase [Eubacteriales bacterium]
MKRPTGGLNLKWKMLGIILCGLIPMLLAVTVLFFKTRSRMEEQYLRMANSSVEKAGRNLDDMLWNIYGVSDNFAYDTELLEYMSKTYQAGEEIYKRRDTRLIMNQIFEGLDMLRTNEKISAIYTYKGVLFNFLDTDNDGEEVLECLEKLEINHPDKLMMFVWYPLQENFLVEEKTGELRQDQVVFGSRRVYSTEKGLYTHIHIFALPEESLYSTYQEIVEGTDSQMYILNEDGSLLSSSEEELVREGTLPDEWKELILNREEDAFETIRDGERWQIYVRPSEVNDWMTVMAVPLKSITAGVDQLYGQIFLAFFVCLLFCVFMILHLYRNFMKPIAAMNEAMQDVNRGNLNAFVEVAKQDEMGKMMTCYNDMLQSINTHVVEKLENERRKKELEMEVLVSQINPHFLYNTLENIVWKSTEAGYPEVGRLAASLGRMYRLSASDDQIIRMQQEIEHLMAYIKIQKNRYGDSFAFDLQTDMAQMREYYTLKLLLQPIVENSFLYGMEGLERTLQIRMDIRLRRDWIVIRILDNGAGMSKERLQEVRRQILYGTKRGEEKNRRSTGIGLHNVEARLELYFNVKNALRIYSKPGEGTLTVLKIPKITGEEARKWLNGQK